MPPPFAVHLQIFPWKALWSYRCGKGDSGYEGSCLMLTLLGWPTHVLGDDVCMGTCKLTPIVPLLPEADERRGWPIIPPTPTPRCLPPILARISVSVPLPLSKGHIRVNVCQTTLWAYLLCGLPLLKEENAHGKSVHLGPQDLPDDCLCSSVIISQRPLYGCRCHIEIWPHGKVTRGSLFDIGNLILWKFDPPCGNMTLPDLHRCLAKNVYILVYKHFLFILGYFNGFLSTDILFKTRTLITDFRFYSFYQFLPTRLLISVAFLQVR